MSPEPFEPFLTQARVIFKVKIILKLFGALAPLNLKRMTTSMYRILTHYHVILVIIGMNLRGSKQLVINFVDVMGL